MKPSPNAPRAAEAQRSWRRWALTVPFALLLGESLYGALGATGAVHWYRVSTPFVVVVAAGVVVLRTMRRFWLRRWRGERAPSAMVAAHIARDAGRFFRLAWAYSALTALLGFVLFLAGAPRLYPYVFEVVAVAYFLVYYPRRKVFDDLLWHPEENA